MENIQKVIEQAFEQRNHLNPNDAPAEVREAVEEALRQLDSGQARVAEPSAHGWQVHEWLKKAVLLSFRLNDNRLMRGGVTNFFDKVPMKFADWSEDGLREAGVRVVPPAAARRGSYIAPGVVLMPSYVNIGAYVDEGTMVDTWATVGSC
ncbi:MAG: 2,3,4,5-tetrahydropyridine-2,6-dicarboxylate N-succinyltransferase, partial [Halorhodospira sp.]